MSAQMIFFCSHVMSVELKDRTGTQWPLLYTIYAHNRLRTKVGTSTPDADHPYQVLL